MKYIAFALLFLAVAINAFRMREGEEADSTDIDFSQIPDEIMDLLFPVDETTDEASAARLQTMGSVWKKISPWRAACMGKCNNRNRHHFSKIDCNKKC